MTAKVLMYSKTTCPFCIRAQNVLRRRGLTDAELELVQIDQHPERRDEMIQLAGGRTTVPQIFIGGQHIGGCDDLMALDRKGGLAPLLGNA